MNRLFAIHVLHYTAYLSIDKQYFAVITNFLIKLVILK